MKNIKFFPTEEHLVEMKNYLIILFCFLSTPFLYSQIGTPNIINIKKNEYHAMGQNWVIDVGPQGYVYSANSQGLLETKGAYWELYRLPKGEPVYSLFVDDSTHIYVGSYEEFGYFEANKYGSLEYYSLSENVRFYNEKITQIKKVDNTIHFYSPGFLFVYDKEDIYSYSLPSASTFLNVINDKTYLYSPNEGIGIFAEGVFTLLVSQEQLKGEEVISLFSIGDNDIVTTKNSGFYIYNGKSIHKWNTEINEVIQKKSINTTLQVNDSLYVLGTNSRGLYAFNRKGEFLWNLSTSDGMQNNSVYSLCIDKNENIWVALDDGISYVENNSDIRYIRPHNDNIGTVYSALFHDKYLYVATNQGVFYSKSVGKEFDFHLIEGLSGQANNLKIFDGQIICCHDRGTFRIEKEKSILLSNIQEATIIHKAIIHQQEVLIQTASRQLNIYKKDYNGKWIYSHTITDFLYPLQGMELDPQGNIWVTHLYKGLFRINLNQNLTETEREENYTLPNNEKYGNKVNLFKIKGRVVFGDGGSYYTYDDMRNMIIPHPNLNEKLREVKDIQKVISVDDNSFWCITGNGFLKIFYTEREAHIERYIPTNFFYNDLPDHNRNIISSADNVIFCLNNKIALIENSRINSIETIEPTIQITCLKVYSQKDTVNLEIHPREVVKVRNDFNSILFKIGSDNLTRTILYKYKLNGLDKDYSPLDPSPFKRYERLRFGSYSFHVIACDYSGKELSSTSYDFEITPPFYASLPALFLYVLLLMILGFLIYIFIHKIIRQSNKKIAREQERLRIEENELKEKEIIKLKNENLQSELFFKSKEMANSTFMLINKNNILMEVKNELNNQKEELGIRYPDKYYSRLINIIDSGINLEDNWSVFQANFDRIHENFFRNLKANYPELTSNDLKICALLRLNLSTKDIANFLGNTIRGVDSARYRLRKKLDIDSETDIVEFLIQFKGHE